LPLFFARLFLLKKIGAFHGERRLANGAQIWQISAHKFGLNFFGEIEQQNFHQTLCAGIFLLGKQSLVKLTPGLNFINVFCARFSYESSFKAKT